MVSSAFATLLVFAVSVFVVAAVATWLVLKLTILATPNHRSAHSSPIPSSGGIAIVVSALAGLSVTAFAGVWQGSAGIYLDGYAATAALIAMFGLADDMGRLQGAVMKLAIQIAGAILLVSMGTVLTAVPLPYLGMVELGGWGFPLTVLWLVGMTNVFNFMDGLDGLAGGTAVIAATALALIAATAGDAHAMIMGIALAAGTLGFLIYNTPRARIFMGDVGSQFLGFSFAAFAVIAADTSAGAMPTAVVPLLLFALIFDVAVTLVRRMSKGADITEAHSDHLYQRLQHSGISHFGVSALHWAMAVANGGLALWMIRLPPELQLAVFVPALAIQFAYLAGVSWRIRRAARSVPAALDRRLFADRAHARARGPARASEM